jgi:hypothetical protein
MNLYHIKKHNDFSFKNREKNNIYLDLNNITNLGDLLFIISNGLSLSYEYNMSLKVINNNSEYNIIKYMKAIKLGDKVSKIDTVISEPREYFFNKIIINNTMNYLIKGKYISYKYFHDNIDKIKKYLFENITELIIQSNDTFIKLRQNKKVILVYINKDTLIKDSYYNNALNKFFLTNNKEEYKILIFTENININNWTAFKNYNCEYLNGNEEKLFLLMIQCDHFIITNSTLPLYAYYFRNNIDATITFPPIWVDGMFNYNDMIPNDNLHISIINKLNNTHIINIENRIDKKLLSLEQVGKISYNPKIFKAHVNENRQIGRTLSHIDLLLKATEINLPYIVICEDNILVENEYYLLYVINEIMANYEWDIILFDNTNNTNVININNFINKIHKCSTTLFYIVNKHYYNKLLDNFVEGRNLLVKDSYCEHNIDIYWIKLQNDNWFTSKNIYISKTMDLNLMPVIDKRNIIDNFIIPLDYLDDIPIFNLDKFKDIYNIHPLFFNYKNIIINIKCIMINKNFIKYSLDILKKSEYNFIKLQSTYNKKTFSDKIKNELIYTKLKITKINYNNIAFLLNNNSIKKIINNNFNLKMGKLIKPIFLTENDKLWLDYYNINYNNT